jgi:hypothetical protein
MAYMRRTAAELFIVWLAICSALKTGDEQIGMRLPPLDQSLADFARRARARVWKAVWVRCARRLGNL